MFQPTLEVITKRVNKLKEKVMPNTNLEYFIAQDIYDDVFPTSELNIRTNAIYYSVCPLAPKNIAYTDLVGRFPYRSIRGNKYILVAYSYDGNAILVKAINSRSHPTIKAVW